MLRRLAVLAIFAAGCPAPLPLEGKLCDEDGRCPIGLRCVKGVCRAQACDPGELGRECSVGVGRCAAAGLWECAAGTQRCAATAGPPAAEACNGVDDDC